MKSYTDINQSKKLAEILPIESADGYWFKGFPSQPYMVYTKGTPNPGEHKNLVMRRILIFLINYGFFSVVKVENHYLVKMI